MSMNFVNEPTRAWNPKNRLREMINEGSDAANVDKLVELLIMDGFDFSLTADAMTPIDEAERVVSVGMGIAVKSEMYLIENLAQAAGAAMGCSRPAYERLKVLPRERFVGMSGEKFTGTQQKRKSTDFQTCGLWYCRRYSNHSAAFNREIKQ